MKSFTFPLFGAAALLALAGCGGHETTDAHADRNLPSVSVTTATVVREPQTRHQPLPGTVHPADRAVVAAKIMATVESADFTIGESVQAGKVLLRLRADELNARLAQAEAGLAQVRRNYERENSLLAQGATTAETVRSLEDQLRLAEARLAEARTMVTYTEVTAPFDGIVTAKNVRRGDLASPGTPLLAIEGRDALQVYVQVPDSLTALDDKARIPVETSGTTITGILAEWSPAADPASRTRLAKLDLGADAPVRSGQYVRVLWPAETVETLWVPASVISPMGQMERVFVVSEDRASLRFVQTGMASGDRVQILAGLAAGETVVAAPPAELKDGQPLEIVSP